MTRRMIDSSLWTNEHFGEMPYLARLLLLGLINHADDQGRVKAHLVFLRSQIFPYDDLSTEQIADCLRLIEANGTIAWYEVSGKHYIQLLNWWEYQSIKYPQDSELPPPHGWEDRPARTPSDYGDDWWALRNQAAQRDGNQCVECNAPSPLEVHHILPLTKGGTNELANLITLCRACHREWHRRINREGLNQRTMKWLVADS